MPQKNKNNKSSKQQKTRKVITGSGRYTLKDVQQVADKVARAAISSGARAAASASGFSQMAGLAESGAIDLYNRASKFIKGHGEYTNSDRLVHNALFNGKFTKESKFAGDINHMVLTGEETICTVTTGSVAGAEVVLKWALNPGDSGFLPKLANLCSGMTRYKPGGMYFKFIPSMSLDLANGNYAFKTIYNAGASPITTFLECTDDTDSVTAQLGQPALCGVECDPATLGHDWLLLRDGTLTDAAGTVVSYTETDMGTMYFALKPAVSVGANTQVGYIKVGYFLTVDGPRAVRSRFGHMTFSNNVGVQNSVCFGTVETVTTGVRRRHIGSCSSIVMLNNAITFPGANLNDYYRVRMAWLGGSVAATVPSVTYSGCETITFNDLGAVLPQNGTTTIKQQIDVVIKITAAEPTVPAITTGSGASLPSATTIAYVEVICLGNALPPTAI